MNHNNVVMHEIQNEIIFILCVMILFGMIWYGNWMGKSLASHHRGDEFPLVKPCSCLIKGNWHA